MVAQSDEDEIPGQVKLLLGLGLVVALSLQGTPLVPEPEVPEAAVDVAAVTLVHPIEPQTVVFGFDSPLLPLVVARGH